MDKDNEGFEIAQRVGRSPFDLAQRLNGGVGIARSDLGGAPEYFAQGTARRNWVTIDTNLPPDVSMIVTLDPLDGSKPDQRISLLAYQDGRVTGWVEDPFVPDSRRELDPEMAKALYDFTDKNLHLPDSDQAYKQLTTNALRTIESRAERAASTAR